jgi:hypothetical protein
MAQTYQCGLCWLADPPGVYVWLLSITCPPGCAQYFYRLPIGSHPTLWVSQLQCSSPSNLLIPLSEDVVKSRIQLRATPPKGTPVQYIANELKVIVAESGM